MLVEPETTPRRPESGFNKLARSYRWLEYLSFGPFLWRTRTAFMPNMRDAHCALVLGDGDGRFSAALLRTNIRVQVRAVDASSGMLRQLQRRVVRQGDAARVKTLHRDATQELPQGRFDLVCTHFFLDCLTEADCEALVRQVSVQVTPGCRWVLSEFAVPEGLLRKPARLLIQALYAAFRFLTGLQVRHLPNYESRLLEEGWQCTDRSEFIGGILRAELWQRSAGPTHPIHMRDEYVRNEHVGSSEEEIIGAPYPPPDENAILPFLPGGDPVPNPEPEQPSLGMPDPGIYEGTGGTASLDDLNTSDNKGRE